MGTTWTFVTATLLMAAPMAVTAQQSDDTPQSCPDTRTQLGMNICAGEAFAEADQALNRLWPDAVAEMRRRDTYPQSDRREGRPTYYQALLRAQRTWIAWRDAQCVVEGYVARGGSMEPMLISQCLEQLTRDRIVQLTMLVEDRD